MEAGDLRHRRGRDWDRPHLSTAIHSSNVASTFSQSKNVNVSGKPQFNTIGHQENHYNYSDYTSGLNILQQHVSYRAFYDSSEQDPQLSCHPGTREQVIESIEAWADYAVSSTCTLSRMLWLYGTAGMGKSAIARTIAERLRAADKLAATFFFSRTNAGCNSAQQLFTTLAWQLAITVPETKPHIARAVSDDPLLPTRSIEAQFDRLIIYPFKQIGTSGSGLSAPGRRIVIIDGVDECDGAEKCTGETMQTRFLKILQEASADDRIPLLFLVCSRPESHIQRMLGSCGSDDAPSPIIPKRGTKLPDTRKRTPLQILNGVLGGVRILPGILIKISGVLFDVKQYPGNIASAIAWSRQNIMTPLQVIWELNQSMQVAKADGITPNLDGERFDTILYDGSIPRIAIGRSSEAEDDIRYYLNFELSTLSTRRALEPDSWLSDEIIDRLVEISCCQFLYATTIVKFVEDMDVHPREALAIVTGLRPTTSSPFPNLDRLYMEVLKRQTQTCSVFLTKFLAVLVILSQDVHFMKVKGQNRNVAIINGLLNLQEGTISMKLRGMHSILKVSRNSVGVHHISFLEFLRDRKRSDQYFVSHGKALWLILRLLIKAILRYTLKSTKEARYAYLTVAILFDV